MGGLDALLKGISAMAIEGHSAAYLTNDPPVSCPHSLLCVSEDSSKVVLQLRSLLQYYDPTHYHYL